MDQTQRKDEPVPPYEALPLTLGNYSNPRTQMDATNAMDLDPTMSPESQPGRATSVLSLDDLEAAHALEGLRAGMRSALS